MGLQILLDRLTQYTIAFSMDKDNLLSVIKSVLIHHLTEFSQLVRQHIRIAQSIRIIQQFGYMQIDLKDSAIRCIASFNSAAETNSSLSGKSLRIIG